MDDTVEIIETRRLEVLEKQAALYGPQTEPSILIEIAELKHKKRNTNTERKAFVNKLDYDFLMDVVSATLIRFNTDQQKRRARQLLQDAWMIAITVIALVTLILQLMR